MSPVIALAIARLAKASVKFMALRSSAAFAGLADRSRRLTDHSRCG
jgi:hypothetical protein